MGPVIDSHPLISARSDIPWDMEAPHGRLWRPAEKGHQGTSVLALSPFRRWTYASRVPTFSSVQLPSTTVPRPFAARSRWLTGLDSSPSNDQPRWVGRLCRHWRDRSADRDTFLRDAVTGDIVADPVRRVRSPGRRRRRARRTGRVA